MTSTVVGAAGSVVTFVESTSTRDVLPRFELSAEFDLLKVQLLTLISPGRSYIIPGTVDCFFPYSNPYYVVLSINVKHDVSAGFNKYLAENSRKTYQTSNDHPTPYD